MGWDDNRGGAFKAAKELYDDKEKAHAIDGIATHWYDDGDFSNLTAAHFYRPEKFILATEVRKKHGQNNILNDNKTIPISVQRFLRWEILFDKNLFFTLSNIYCGVDRSGQVLNRARAIVPIPRSLVCVTS